VDSGQRKPRARRRQSCGARPPSISSRLDCDHRQSPQAQAEVAPQTPLTRGLVFCAVQNYKHSRLRVPGSASDPTRLGRALVRSAGALTPPHLSADRTPIRARARSGTRPSGCAVGGRAGRPRAPSRAPQHSEERSVRAFGAGAPQFRACAKLCGGPPAPPSFGTARRHASAVQAEWGHGGRAARPTNAGGYCEHTQGLAGAE
jgi:hypothetical protein